MLDGQELTEEHPLFVAEAKRRGFYSRELMNRITREGSVSAACGMYKDHSKECPICGKLEITL